MFVFTKGCRSCYYTISNHIKAFRFVSSLSSVKTNSCTREQLKFRHPPPKLLRQPPLLLPRTSNLIYYTEPTKCSIITTRKRYTFIKDNNEDSTKQKLAQVTPRLGMLYKCKICNTQNSHTFSKKAYQEGVVIVQCVNCKSNHLIADNLGWFKDVNKRNIEEIMAAKGEEVKKIADLDMPKDMLDVFKIRPDSQE